MSVQYTRDRQPWLTISPSTLSALDIGGAFSTDFRPKQWLERPDSIFEQATENDMAYLAWLESFPSMQFGLTQVVTSWRVGRPADNYTRNAAAITAADTYISLDDGMIAKIGFKLDCIQYGATYRVLDVDDDLSEGWTNDNSVACNVQVERMNGPAVAIPANEVMNAGTAPIGELGVPKRDTTTTPGDPVWNNMSYVGVYGSLSDLQDQSEMLQGWGTREKICEDLYFTHRLAKQHEMLFGQQYIGNDPQDTEGQMYLGKGIVPQIKTHVMEAGSLGINLVWPKLNDFWEGTFDSELSASQKAHFCGAAQFRDIRKTAQEFNADVEMLGIQSGVDNMNSIGANSMKVTLNSGRVVMVHELRKAFSQPNLVDWGITQDANNLKVGVFGDISEKLYEDIEDKAQRITLHSDALIDTWLMAVIDESTFGVIRGGTRGLVDR